MDTVKMLVMRKRGISRGIRNKDRCLLRNGLKGLYNRRHIYFGRRWSFPALSKGKVLEIVEEDSAMFSIDNADGWECAGVAEFKQ